MILINQTGGKAIVNIIGFKRKDNLEIGPLYKGQGLEARKSYVQGIVDVLNNCKKYFTYKQKTKLKTNISFLLLTST